MKRSPGRWRHVRYLRTGLTLEQLTSVIQKKFDWPDFEIGTSRGRKLASVDMDHMDVLINELPERNDEYRFQVHLTIAREEGMIGQVLLERWQALLDELHEPLRFREEYKFWMRSERKIRPFCESLRKKFELPPFEHDAENENEWCISQAKHLVVHVSRAYKYKTFHDFNPGECPRGCNYSVVLKVRESAPDDWRGDAVEQLWLMKWIRVLMRLGERRVYHRGTWHKQTTIKIP